MKKQAMAWTALAVVGLMADVAPGQETVQAPGAMPAVTAQPMQTTTYYRTGLFGRMRARRQTVVSQPMTVVPASTTTQTPMPANSGVQQAQAINPQTNVRQSGYLPLQSGSGVQQAQATQAAPMTTTAMADAPVVEQRRMGLLARLRARRGN